MTVVGALTSFGELGAMSPHKRASRQFAPLCFRSLAYDF